MWQIFFLIPIRVPVWLRPPLALLFPPHLDFTCLSILALSAFLHFFREQHPPLPPFTSSPVWYTRHGLETASLDTLPPPLTCWLSHPCILCGRGDNSVQHWLNFCPIPALAGSLLLNRPWRTRFWYFTRSHSLGHRSIIAGLWVATRQFVHERSGLPPPSLVYLLPYLLPTLPPCHVS